MTTASTLTFQRLGCHKGGRQLFQLIDCTLDAGNWLHVAGVNGVGKTSLLRMVCGLAPVESGEILWNGVPIGQQAAIYRQSLCYLGHLNGLQEFMTVSENMAFSAALAGFTVDSRQCQDLLVRLGMRGRGNQLTRHLSQGQKRRVALARLVLCRARLWVLDEPFVAMDDSGIAMLASLISEHLDNGGLVVLTSHQPVAIGSVAGQVLDLKI